MNNSVFPFTIREVRQAFSLAIDREKRSQLFNHSLNDKQLSLMPPGIPGYDVNLGYDFNPEAAKAILAAAIAMYPDKFPDGKFPTVNFYFTVTPDTRVADFYKDQFKTNLGVDIQPVQLSAADFSRKRDDEQGNFDGLFVWGWCADYLYPSDWLYLVWGTPNLNNNLAHYSNPIFDVLSLAADGEPDPQLALRKYQEAHEYLVNDYPVIFLNTPQVARLVKPRVLNLQTSPLDGGLAGALFWEDIDLAMPSPSTATP